jgi:imidazolonepropionase-like amidohydrolase
MALTPRLSSNIAALFISAFFFLLSAHAQKPSSTVADTPLILKHVTVVDVRTGTLERDQTLIIDHKRIVSIGPGKSAKFPSSAAIIDCSGLFAIPGLWDMHVHLAFGDWFPGAKDISLPLFIANGVTGVRDMGSELDVIQNWRSELASGRLIGPRIYTSGPMLDGPKPRFPSSVAIATPDDARRAVADLKRRGADFIKLQSLIPRDAVFAIADEAKKQQIPFEGHVPDSVRASEMSEAGMKSSSISSASLKEAHPPRTSS